MAKGLPILALCPDVTEKGWTGVGAITVRQGGNSSLSLVSALHSAAARPLETSGHPAQFCRLQVPACKIPPARAHAANSFWLAQAGAAPFLKCLFYPTNQNLSKAPDLAHLNHRMPEVTQVGMYPKHSSLWRCGLCRLNHPSVPLVHDAAMPHDSMAPDGLRAIALGSAT